jgi:hypothetical protein
MPEFTQQEEMMMKRINLIWVAGIAMISATSITQADTISGKLVGLECASHGVVCPTDKLDPHLAVETDFVLVREGGTYMFLPNLPRAVKYRHVLQDVSVSGELDGKYNSVRVRDFAVDGKSVWSPKLQHEAAAALLRGETLN